jgi:tRNA threonylcarbamoyladenosine biosynthesis protein TsaB
VLILALDAALARCSAALWQEGVTLAARHADAGRGHASLLPPMAQELLDATPGPLAAVAAIIGPGGFSGIRTALALAEGIALGRGVPVVAVTTGEALAEAAGAGTGTGREVWAAIDNRRGRLVLQRFAPGPLALGEPVVLAEADLPRPVGPVVAVGDAAPQLAARLAARGADIRLANARLPEAAHAAAVAARRLAGTLPGLAARPLYVEPPAVRPPA